MFKALCAAARDGVITVYWSLRTYWLRLDRAATCVGPKLPRAYCLGLSVAAPGFTPGTMLIGS